MGLNIVPEAAAKEASPLRQRTRKLAADHGVPRRIADAVADDMEARGVSVTITEEDMDRLGQTLDNGAAARLKSFFERIERLEEEKAALAADIGAVFAEAKSAGYDTKAMKQILRIRKMDDNERLEHEALVSTYMHALGMAEQLPLL